MNPVKLVSRRWIIPTILVIVGMIVLARLGIWQLDRLQQKRTTTPRWPSGGAWNRTSSTPRGCPPIWRI